MLRLRIDAPGTKRKNCYLSAMFESDGVLELAGEMYSPFVLGIVVSKDNNALRDAVVAGMQGLIDDGSYQKVLTGWGVEAGAISTIGINGALD